MPKDFDAACFTFGDFGRPCPSEPLDARYSDTTRTKDIVEMLEQDGADLKALDGENIDGEGLTPMDIAVHTKCTEMVNELRIRGIAAQDLTTEGVTTQPKGRENAKALLDSKYVLLNEKQRAAEFGKILKRSDYKLFNGFMKYGSDLTARGERWNRTGMNTLVDWGHANLLKVYAEEVAGPNNKEWESKEENPGTLLCHACEQRSPCLNVVKVLVEEANIDVNRISDREGDIYKGSNATALHGVAAGRHFWNIKAFEYLLDHGADIEAINGRGETPLMAAVGSDYANEFWKEETIHILLERGANLNVLNDDGASCLNMADHADIACLLLSYGAEIKLGKRSCLTSDLELRNVDKLRVLLETGSDPNTDHLLYKVARPNDQHEYEDDIWRVQSQREIISLLL